jgi:hypothetical protein
LERGLTCGKIKLVHIYGQKIWHDDVFIIANREGLLALQKAISEALEKGKGVAEVFVADGEGYNVEILLNDADWPSDVWDSLVLPYTDGCVQEIVSLHGDKVIQPWELWEKYSKGVKPDA